MEEIDIKNIYFDVLTGCTGCITINVIFSQQFLLCFHPEVMGLHKPTLKNKHTDTYTSLGKTQLLAHESQYIL